jgi:hypothetical protein
VAEKKIGQDTYRVHKAGAREQQRMLLRIGRIAGPAITAFTDALAGDGDREKGALNALGGMLTNANPDEAEQLLVDLCQMAQVNTGGMPVGQYDPVIFDHHMDGLALQTCWEVAGFVLEVNFRDFFDAAVSTNVGKAVRTAAVSARTR